MKVYGAVLGAHKPLAAFTAKELKADPLIFLNCGHIFPVSTMDSQLQLDSYYSRSQINKWLSPVAIQVCILKYGRCSLLIHADGIDQCDCSVFQLMQS